MKEVAEFSLKKAQELGCKYVEVRAEKRTSNSLTLKNGNPELAGFETTSGIGIRYIINNNLGFISLNNFDRDKVFSLIKKSVNMTKKSSRISKNIYCS